MDVGTQMETTPTLEYYVHLLTNKINTSNCLKLLFFLFIMNYKRTLIRVQPEAILKLKNELAGRNAPI